MAVYISHGCSLVSSAPPAEAERSFAACRFRVLRARAEPCLIYHNALKKPTIDVAFPLTVLSMPSFTGRLLVLFIYSYVISTALKV